MKEILWKIMDILETIPNMDKDIMMSIMNPIHTEAQAKKMLEFLKKNKDNKEIMRVSYLIPNKLKIVKS